MKVMSPGDKCKVYVSRVDCSGCGRKMVVCANGWVCMHARCPFYMAPMVVTYTVDLATWEVSSNDATLMDIGEKATAQLKAGPK